MSETRLRLEAATRAAFENFSGRIGVAVSGGSDSLALLHLCVEAFGVDRVCAATVDHQLRLDSADEAETVGRIAAQLGVGHHILKWNRPDEQGNLSDQARRARYRLLVQWAEQSEVAAVAIGHTADDQAETFLMRLARRSGLSGLAAMPERRDISGIAFLRPLLSFRREDLRDYLRSLDVAWQTFKGRTFLAFAKEARIEVRKVVWPTRQETTHTTLIVMVATVIMALILWGLDGILFRAVGFLTGLEI